MIASGIIGSRASKQLADPDTARRAGIKVFAFWVTVVAAAWLIPALSGIWTSVETAEHTAGIAIGIVALGYILFGLMFRPGLSDLRHWHSGRALRPKPSCRRQRLRNHGSTHPRPHRCRRALAEEERYPMIDSEQIILNEMIHQPTRLRIMTLLVSQPESSRLTYGFIQRNLGLTGGNLTTHLRKLEDANYLRITKEFHDQKPRTWIQATHNGRIAFADYYANLQKILGIQPSD